MTNYTFRDASGTSKTARSVTTGGVELPYTEVLTAVPTVVSFQQVTVTASAVTLASLCSGSALPAGATHALVRADTSNTDTVRWTDDGSTNPTATLGFEVAPGEVDEWAAIAGIKVISESGSQKLNVSFRKYDS